MRKFIILTISIVFLFLICGCTIQKSSTDVSDETSVSEAPIQFENEEAFIKAIKTEGENNIFDIKNITYYYRPKNIPNGAVLKYVEVLDTYVMFVYTFDSDKLSKDLTKIMKIGWFRKFGGYQENFINNDLGRGWKKQQLEGAVKGTTYVAEKSFSKAKELKDNTINVAWGISWVQDGECFGGSIPYSISEKDIAKHLEMEKVVIE